jgi:catalase
MTDQPPAHHPAHPPDHALGHQLVEDILRDYPDHQTDPPLRPVHSFGFGVGGTFMPSEVASTYCTARLFQAASTPAIVRFSNGSGSGTEDDSAADVHGMATKFELDDGETFDLIAMTLNVFFARRIALFEQFTAAAVPRLVQREGFFSRILDTLRLRSPAPPPPPSGMSGLAGIVDFANTHRHSMPGVIGDAVLPRPSSWARAKYSTVHVFGVRDDDGVVRRVKFDWTPVVGIHTLAVDEHGKAEPVAGGSLRQELTDRIGRQPVRFQLVMTIGEAGDPIDDPTAGWPLWRQRVVMGTLALDEVLPDQVHGCELLSFNPSRLPAGIVPPTDEIIAARAVAYEASFERRTAATCPAGLGFSS